MSCSFSHICFILDTKWRQRNEMLIKPLLLSLLTLTLIWNGEEDVFFFSLSEQHSRTKGHWRYVCSKTDPTVPNYTTSFPCYFPSHFRSSWRTSKLVKQLLLKINFFAIWKGCFICFEWGSYVKERYTYMCVFPVFQVMLKPVLCLLEIHETTLVEIWLWLK